MKSIVTLGLILAGLCLLLPASPVRAAEAVWELAPPVVIPESGDLRSSDGYHSWSHTGDKMYHHFRHDTPQPVDNYQEFSFTIPPPTLKPGATVNLQVTGISGGSDPSISGETFEYSAAGVALTGNTRVSVGFYHGNGPKTAKPSFVVPPFSDTPFIITTALLTAAGENADGFKIHWIYRVVKPQKINLDLEFYSPEIYLEIGSGSWASDVMASLTDEDGKGIAGKTIIFFIEKENPGAAEPGKNLFDVLAYETRTVTHVRHQQPEWDEIQEYHPYLKKGIPDAGQLSPQLDKSLISPNRVYLGPGITTDSDGTASINLIEYGLIDPRRLASELIRQRTVFDKKGLVSGNIIAGVYNEDTRFIEHQTSLRIEYPAMAVITRISGEGPSERYKQDYLREYPEDAPWGPGKVRVKRVAALPLFEYQESWEGFLLMPGDILDIDSGVEVEIAWFTGDRVIARVPPKHEAASSIERHEHARLIMLGSAYDSGFKTNYQKMLESATFGFGVDKGFELLVESIPYVGKILKEGGELAIAIVQGLKDVEWSDIDIITRIRLRSRLIVDNSGEGLKVYNLQGSPDIQTTAGDQVTLPEGQTVAITDEGRMGEAVMMDIRQIEEQFYSTAPVLKGGQPTPSLSTAVVKPATLTSQPRVTLPKTSLPRNTQPKAPDAGIPSALWYFVAGGLGFAVLLFLLWRRRKKQR